MTALVWLRSDLRISDNPALHHACASGAERVVAVFLLAPGQWREHDWGSPKVDFVLRNAARMSVALASRGIPLLVRRADRFADAAGVLMALAHEHRCDALYFNREYEVNERRRDEEVRQACRECGVQCVPFDDQTVIPPGALLTQAGAFYSVFTPFKKAWLAQLERQGTPALLPPPPVQCGVGTSPDPLPEEVSGFAPRAELASLWPAGEEEAERRLERFVSSAVGDYHERRDLPGESGTSRLSPYLAAGVVSPRRCLLAALEARAARSSAGPHGADSWISELIWREFYRHVLVGFPRVSMGRAFRLATERVAWREDEDGLAAWQAGRTGVPIVDAGMRELAATGWMHNRARMLTAMFLTKDLLVHWRGGERHFARHLVDADLANNNGGWQWSASSGVDAAPYFRIFNPYSQSRRFDPDGTYIRRWVPELASVSAAALHDPRLLTPAERRRRDYAPPLVDHAQARQRVVAAFRTASTGKA